MPLRCLRKLSLLVLGLALIAPHARAQNAPAAPLAAPVDPTLVMSASAASLDKVAAMTKELGVGDVPFFSAAFIEQQMPFIGAGGLAAGRPIGVLFYVGPQIDLEKSATFVLPVNAGKAELKSFVDNGAQPVAGRTDLVTLEGVSFRRAKEQFIFGQVAGAVSAVKEDALTAAYANDTGAVARVDFDIASFKKAMPERYEAFFADIDQDVNAADLAERTGADLAIGAMRDLTRLGLLLARSDAGGVRLGIRAEPFELVKEPATKFARPGLPPGTTIFRADVAYPPSKAFSRVTGASISLVEKQPAFAQLMPPQQDQVRALVTRVSNLLLGGETGSLGIERVNDQIVITWITRGAGVTTDIEREIREIVTQADEVAKLMKTSAPFAPPTSYAVGATKVHRLTLLEGGKPELYIDMTPKDGSVMMSIAAGNGKFIERLLSLPAEGEATTLVSGWLDLSALSDTGLLPDAQAVGLDPKAAADLPAAMKGQRLDWTISPDGPALRMDVNIPKALLQNVSKAMGWTK